MNQDADLPRLKKLRVTVLEAEFDGRAARSTGSKVPAVTLVFWILKVFATTLGETAGDAVSMSLKLGYLVGTAIFAVAFAAAVAAQIRAARFHAWLYWLTIIATTTVGTTIADYVDRDLGIGYAGGSALLLTGVLATLFTWYRTLGTVAVDTVSTPRAEIFYWVTIMFSQTLGTALGDWTADDVGLGLGYGGAALVFGGLLTLIALLYFATRVSRTALFWAAFVLTRPLGAAVGDFLDKPIAKGGLNLDRFAASGALVAVMIGLLIVFRQRAATRAH